MKNRLRTGLLALLVILSLSVPAFAMSPADVATADIRKLVDVKSIRGAKGYKRVAVPGYRVIFTTRSKVVARAEDWLGGVGGESSSGETVCRCRRRARRVTGAAREESIDPLVRSGG